MLRTLGVVEVSTCSSTGSCCRDSLPTRRLAGKPLLEWVVRRMTDALLLEEVVVLAADDAQATRISRAVPADVSVFSLADESDSLARLAATVDAYRADAIVRASVENPFIDPALLDRLIAGAEAHSFCDYISYCSAREGSTLLARLGVQGEWFRAEAILRANKQAKTVAERTCVTKFILGHPESFHLRMVPLPDRLDRSDLRLSIGVQEDWEHAEMILDALGPENLDWQQIANLLEGHPDILGRMEELNLAEAVPAG